jgi:hypothetical protein
MFHSDTYFVTNVGLSGFKDNYLHIQGLLVLKVPLKLKSATRHVRVMESFPFIFWLQN